MHHRFLLAALLVLVPTARTASAQGGGDAERFVAFDVDALELGEETLPVVEARYASWGRLSHLWPSVRLDDGDAYFDGGLPSSPEWGSMGWSVPDVAGTTVVARIRGDAASGELLVRAASGDRLVRRRFTVPAEAVREAEPAAFRRAEARHFARLTEGGLPGAAWFRHRQREALDALQEHVVADVEPVEPGRPGDAEAELVRSLGLFTGGRALSENLQLDRVIPFSGAPGEPGETVDVVTIQGVTVRAFDWTPLLEGVDEDALATDPLAALVPADQHALFFRAFDELVRLADEAAEHGAPVLAAFEAASRDALTRERYEHQLCLSLDAATRLLGPLVVKSAAVTGSDPYLRTGSDVALLFEVADAGVFRAFVAKRHAEARAADPAARAVAFELGGRGVTGVETPDRRVSSFVADLDGFVVVTNSRAQLALIAAVRDGREPALGDLDEYAFFRHRYRRDEAETGFLVVTDAAIRRWCGPRWRIAASRRTRAAALLAELEAVHAVERLTGDVEPRPLGIDELPPAARRFDLGELHLTGHGVHSSIWGTRDFLTPIAELSLERVSKAEAALYDRWRDGYQRNWSNWFDPIAVRFTVADDSVGADVTVLPLIVGSEYGDFVGYVRGARLEPGDGDRPEETVLSFLLALDNEGEEMRELGGVVGDFGLGENPLAWLGDWMSIHLEPSPVLDELAEADDPMSAWEALEDDLNELPLVVELAVASPMRLAAFLGAVRAFVDGASPGILEWRTVTREEGSPYVRLSSSLDDDLVLYYATTPRVWILSLHEPSLLAALVRWEAEAEDTAREAPVRLGESVLLEARRDALLYLGLLDGDDPAEVMRLASWANLPILNEWKRLFPDRDPLDVHREAWGERLVCPGGGAYVWNAEWRTMESTVFGHPGDPRVGPVLPPVLDRVTRVRFGLTFEHDGLRARGELVRSAGGGPGGAR